MKTIFSGVSQKACAVAVATACSLSSSATLAASGSGFLEEIVVTARKRSESLQDVPVSVSAFSAADVESKSITSLKELGQFTPNLSFSNNGQSGSSGAVVFIRGIGQVDPNVFWDPGVGIYVDGVYMGRMQGVDIDLLDLERVEVLRGPQGTLFGKNTIGGAINIVTAKPGDEFSGEVELAVGRFDRADGKFNLNMPLIDDTLAMSIAGSVRNRDGFGKRVDYVTGDKIDAMGDRDRQNFQAKLAWTVTDDLEVLWSIDSAKIRENGSVRETAAFASPGLVGLLNTVVDPDYSAAAFATDSHYVSYATGSNTNDLDALGTSLTVDWNLGKLQLKSITSYRETKAKNGTDPDGSPYTLIDLLQDIDQDQYSQEFQLSGLSFDDRLNWVAGIFYFNESNYSNEVLGVYSEVVSAPGPDLSFTRNIWADSESYAVFGQGTFALTDKLDLTAGLRYSEEKKTVARERLAHVSGGVIAPREQKSDTFDAFSPRVSLDYSWNDDVMTYLSAARGFKSGGINGDSFNEFTFSTFRPEFVWTYEVGLRSEFLDRRVQFNASVFYSDYSDIQFTVRRADPDTGRSVALVDNAGKAEMKGFEAELIAMPIPELVLSAGFGYINAEYTEVDPALPITENTRFPKTPEKSVTLSGDYTLFVGDGDELIVHADWSYKSEIEHDILNSPYGFQDSYSIVNARLTYENVNGNWAVSLFGTNLTDEDYIMAVTDFAGSLGFADVQWARPREWGVSVKYGF